MTTTLEDLLQQIIPEQGETFSPTRYPYTYACDFLRNNPHVIPAEVRNNPNVQHAIERPLMSRADASRVRSVWAGFEGRDDEDLACVLADAYLSVHRIVRPA